PGAAFRRHAAALANRPLSGAGTVDPIDGRAVRRARRHHPAWLAGRGCRPRRRHRRHRHVRHPRSGRGDLSWRPGDLAAVESGSSGAGYRRAAGAAARPAFDPRERRLPAAAPPAVRLHPGDAAVKMRGRGWAVPMALLLAAEVIMRVNGTRSDALARPSDIAVAVWTALTDGTIATQSGQTLGAAAGGIVIGGGLGLAVGLWLGLSRIAARLSVVSVELFRPIPSVALIPVALLVYGFGYRMEIAIVSFACFWPMLILS